MILCVTPNPAWDVTYTVTALEPGSVHHVTDVTERAGGKGINVAAVAHRAGHPVLVVAPAGGSRRADFAADLARRGLRVALVDTPVAIRRSIAVVAPDAVTMFNESGQAQPDEVWETLESTLRQQARDARVVTISGSLPPATPPDLLARLTYTAHEAGAQVVLDCRGDHLMRALAQGPELVKPNAEEAAASTGYRDPVEAARALVHAGAGAALISRGADGVVLVDRGGSAIAARLPSPVAGNPTGAGDALTAAVAMALDTADQRGWAAILRAGVAWGAAAVLAPVAGEVDPVAAEGFRSSIVIEELT